MGTIGGGWHWGERAKSKEGTAGTRNEGGEGSRRGETCVGVGSGGDGGDAVAALGEDRADVDVEGDEQDTAAVTDSGEEEDDAAKGDDAG